MALTAEGLKDLKRRLFTEATTLGFCDMGVTAAETQAADRAALERFLKLGRHGDMAWMDNDRRGRVGAIMPGARSVIVLAMSYAPEADPREIISKPERGAISVYAQGKDYHDVIKKRLKRLARWLLAEAAEGRETRDVKVFVDTAPIMEKPLAQRAGLGWQGKHTNLVSRRHGSWTFLGEIFTTLALPPDTPEADHCGTCRACLDACPTDAFPAPYELDAARCISYLTIEHKGPVAPDLMAAMGNHVYGCDDCLAACPWNKFADAGPEAALSPREALTRPMLKELALLDDEAFRARFAGTPVKRTGRDRFLRNVAIAIGNGGGAEDKLILKRLTRDTSPLVAETARWAEARLEARLTSPESTAA